MKKYLSLFLCISVIFSLTACSGNTNQVQEERPTDEASMEQIGSDLAERVIDPESTESSDTDINLAVQSEKAPAENVLEPKPTEESVAVPGQAPNPSGEASLITNSSETNLPETVAVSETPMPVVSNNL